MPKLDNLGGARQWNDIADQRLTTHQRIVINEVRKRESHAVSLANDGDGFGQAATEHLIVNLLPALQAMFHQKRIHRPVGEMFGIDQKAVHIKDQRLYLHAVRFLSSNGTHRSRSLYSDRHYRLPGYWEVVNEMVWQTHPWVAERQGKLRIAVQVFPLPDDPNPTEAALEAARVAEDVGLDGFFIGDHPGYHIDPWLHLSAVATTTSHVQLGSVVNCVFHRHPTMHARQAADLDRISNGRAILGLGIGWNVPEFAQLGIPFPPVPERQDALDEAMTIIDGMFGPEPVTFDGNHWRTELGWIGAAPVQKPRPPVLIAGAGKRTIRQVARWAEIANFGNSTNTGNVKDADGYREKIAAFGEACLEIGRPPDSLLMSHFTSWMMLEETTPAAKAKLDRYYPDGLTEEQTRTRIWGDPGRAVSHFAELAEVGFSYFVVQIQDARDLTTIRLLGDVVRPRVTRG